MLKKALLIVDRDSGIRAMLRTALGQQFSIDAAATIVEAVAVSRQPKHAGRHSQRCGWLYCALHAVCRQLQRCRRYLQLTS